jgi:hypothetical protein
MSLSEDDVARIDAVADARTGALRTTQEQRDAFRMIETYMVDRYNIEMDADAALDSRRRARENAGIFRTTTSRLASESSTESPDTLDAPTDTFLTRISSPSTGSLPPFLQPA